MATLRLSSFVVGGAACHFATPVIVGARPENLHDHDFIELFWIEAGEGWHWINGERRRLSAGSLVFIRPADRHAFSGGAEGLRMVNVAFAARSWRELQRRYGLMNVFDQQRDSPLELTLSAGQLAGLESIASELRIGKIDRAARDRFLLNLAHLIEAETDMTAPRGGSPMWLRKMVAGMSNALQANPARSTQELAEQAGCSPEHVARMFRRWLGRTPTDVLNDAKLARAAARLAGTADDILQISLDSGFGNLSHFYKLFGDRYRMTPRQYRIEQQRIVWSGAMENQTERRRQKTRLPKRGSRK